MAKAKKNERTIHAAIHYSFPTGDVNKRAYALDLKLSDPIIGRPVNIMNPKGVLRIWTQIDEMMDFIFHRSYGDDIPAKDGQVIFDIGVDEIWDWMCMSGSLRYHVHTPCDFRCDPEQMSRTAFDGNAGALYAGIVAIAQLALNR